MKAAALTNIPHHTLTTRIILNNISISIHINGDIQSVSNNRLVWTTKWNNQSFKLLLHVWAMQPAYHTNSNLPVDELRLCYCIVQLYGLLIK